MNEKMPTGKVLDSYEFSNKRGGRESIYDWDTLLDGQVRELKKGRDINKEIKSFESSASAQARKRRGKVIYGRPDAETLILQFVQKS